MTFDLLTATEGEKAAYFAGREEALEELQSTIAAMRFSPFLPVDLATPLYVLALPEEGYTALRRARILTLKAVLRKSDGELLKIIGLDGLRILDAALSRLNLVRTWKAGRPRGAKPQ
jgi:hypothetical protein